MSNQASVSVIMAAKMADISRQTFYKDVKRKKITLTKDEQGRSQVEVSELIRVYGNNLKTPEQLAEEEERTKLLAGEPSVVSLGDKIELQSLRTEIRHLQELRQAERAAAAEKADQQNQQIEFLKGLLESEKTERQRTTALLTDQRNEKDKQAERLIAVERENAALKNAGFFTRLFSFKQR